ncbi:hypothetical protein VHEMI10149 [[Torrubiella] hemipterigena]|uniref:Uncharacterized protein n=1 Tax=[Torrubiella] hemipterigena TaxID=1531966 RepID=A0A0A1TRD5_9HYPO|nr:hypothetical protein VHEMI10149 [[Torrubiella] hemipterigena]
MAHTLGHHAVHHIGEWLIHGAPGASSTWDEITADYAGEARKCVNEILTEHPYVYFDFTDVSRGISKWITIGDEDELRIRYGKDSSNTEVLLIQGEYFEDIKRISATYKVVREMTGYNCKTYQFKRGEFVSTERE